MFSDFQFDTKRRVVEDCTAHLVSQWGQQLVAQ